MSVVESDLKGRRVLLIEDESTISMLIEDTLIEIGCEVVATASRLPEAIEKANGIDCDVAILDVNLNGKQTFDVAYALRRRSTPFVFSTGYGRAVIPKIWRTPPFFKSRSGNMTWKWRCDPFSFPVRELSAVVFHRTLKFRNNLIAAQAAPNPLSMFTTTTPGAQEARALFNAVMPCAATP